MKKIKKIGRIGIMLFFLMLFVKPVAVSADTETECNVKFYYYQYRAVTDLSVTDESGNQLEIVHADEAMGGRLATFSVTCAPGEYQYSAYAYGGGDNVKKGSFVVEEGETTKEIGLLYLKFTISDSTGNSKGGDIELRDSDYNIVEPVYSIDAAGGGKSAIVYILEVKEQDGELQGYTYTCEMDDPQYSIISDSGNGTYIPTSLKNTSGKTVTLTASNITYNVQVKLPKNANAHFYKHPNKAYTALTELETSVDESNDEYDTYSMDVAPGVYVDVIAGGDSTPYKRSVFYSDVVENKDIELEYELETKEETSTYDTLSSYNDLYTNVSKGYLTMEVDEEKLLEGFRMWQTVTNTITNRFVEPDMHYEVIAGEDVITLTDTGSIGRKYQTIKALKEGIAVIRITYDEMDIDGILNAKAIDDANIGIVIVNVGGTSENISSNIELTDYDTVYFAGNTKLPNGENCTGGDTTSYTFKPTGADEIFVRVRKPIHLNGDWADKSAWKSYTPSVSGEYTVDLYEGRNIIEISDGTNVIYQTIAAKKIDITITNNTNPDCIPIPGDEVSVSFDGLELPIYKMAGIYNPGYSMEGGTVWVEYSSLDGVSSEEGEGIRSSGVQYTIDVYNTITYTVGEVAQSVLAGGRIHCGHLGSTLDAHHNIPLTGLSQNLNASGGANTPYFSIMPTITLDVESAYGKVYRLISAIDVDNYLDDIKAVINAKDAYDALTDEQKEKVTNYEVLKNILDEVSDVIDVITAIEKLPDSVTLSEEETVKTIKVLKTAYDILSSEKKAVVYNSERLLNLAVSITEQEEKQARINNVLSLIEKLPKVEELTLDDTVITAITEAQAAYDALLGEEQTEITNFEKLQKLQERLIMLQAAQPVIESIAAIGEVTEENYREKEKKILVARSAYDVLTDEQKALVTNLAVLTQAEYDFAIFVGDEDTREVMAAIRKLEVPLAATRENGEPIWEIWKDWKDYVINTRSLANMLAADKLERIENLSDLEEAEGYLETLKVRDVSEKLLSLPSADGVVAENEAEGVKLTNEELLAIADAWDSYNNLTQEQKDLLSESAAENLLALVDIANTYEAYNSNYLQLYVDELAEYYQQYKDVELSRFDVPAVQKVINKYDTYDMEAQKRLADMTSEISGDVSFADMYELLNVKLQQAETDITEAESLSTTIKSLPEAVTLDNLDEVKQDIASIEQKYQELSENAKSYIRNWASVEAIKAVIEELELEVSTFKTAVPSVKAEAAAYNRVTISWGSIDKAISYVVYRKAEGGEWKALITTAALSYADCTTTGSKTYYYTVKALSSNWGGSVESSYNKSGIRVTTPFGGSTVTLKKVKSVSSKCLKITWSKVDGATGYCIYRASSKNGVYKPVKTINGGNTTSFKQRKLVTGKRYYYKVRAFSKSGNTNSWSEYSSIKSGKPKPAAVKIKKVIGKKNMVVIKWKKKSKVSGYVVYRATSKNGKYKKVAVIKKKKITSYTDKNLKSKKKYFYKVRAYRTVNGKRIYGKYSSANKVTVQ